MNPLFSSSQARGSRRTGAVLLEVILALILFVAAATVISSSLSASIATLERMRRDTHAANLATTVVAEVEMGIRPAANAGPEPFPPPFDQWMFEVMVDGGVPGGEEEAFALRSLEVVVRDTESDTVYRLFQQVPAGPPKDDTDLFDLLEGAKTGGLP